MKKPMTRLVIEVPVETKKKLRAITRSTGATTTFIVRGLLDQYLAAKIDRFEDR